MHVASMWINLLLLEGKYDDMLDDMRFGFYLESRLKPIYAWCNDLICSTNNLTTEPSIEVQMCAIASFDILRHLEVTSFSINSFGICNNKKHCDILKCKKECKCSGSWGCMQCKDGRYLRGERKDTDRILFTIVESCDQEEKYVSPSIEKRIQSTNSGVLHSNHKKYFQSKLPNSWNRNLKRGNDDINAYLDNFMSGKSCGDAY